MIYSVCLHQRRGGGRPSDRRLLVLPLDHLIMLAVLQVIGQFLVVGLLCVLLRRFALKPKQQTGLFDAWRWAWPVLILQPTTGGSARLFSIS